MLPIDTWREIKELNTIKSHPLPHGQKCQHCYPSINPSTSEEIQGIGIALCQCRPGLIAIWGQELCLYKLSIRVYKVDGKVIVVVNSNMNLGLSIASKMLTKD